MRFSLAATLAAALLALARDASSEERPPSASGLYGGLAMAASLEPFGSGTDMQRHCADLGAADCGTPMPLGAGFFGYVGWALPPFGVEVMLAGFADYDRPAAHYDGVTHAPHGNPLLSVPKRDETFILFRGGGALALRGRYTWERPRWQPSVAAGLGLAYRYMALEREVTADGGLEDRPYFPTGTPYASPAVTVDGSMQYRATPKVAFVLGLGIWMESAWSSTRSVADPTRTLAGNAHVEPIATPAYEMAHGLQIYFMPYVGLQLGP